MSRILWIVTALLGRVQREIEPGSNGVSVYRTCKLSTLAPARAESDGVRNYKAFGMLSIKTPKTICGHLTPSNSTQSGRSSAATLAAPSQKAFHLQIQAASQLYHANSNLISRKESKL